MSAPLPTEKTEVEQRLLEQLKGQGWAHIEGDIDIPELTERTSFREVLLRGRLAEAVRRINLDEAGNPWLDEDGVEQAITALERLGTGGLLETNRRATELLLGGTFVQGPDGKAHPVRFVEFDPARLDQNDFLVINQFRVDGPGAVADRGFIIPDAVLFVNGIPLVVIEAKSPSINEPLTEAIRQLHRYSKQSGDEPHSAERLFRYSQLLVATSFYKARLGTVGASFEHFLAWKDPYPLTPAEVAARLGLPQPFEQPVLVAGALAPARLLDIVQNFTLFKESGGRLVKIVPRYQQYRAVGKAIQRLQTGKTRAASASQDQRGGIIWHTQGSGKSFTMVYLIRRMRTLPGLRRFKVVVITDRTDLEKQLAGTAQLTGEPLVRARSVAALDALLAQPGAGLVFGTIQKMRGDDEGEGDVSGDSDAVDSFEHLNPSEEILILVDEAHRSHTSALHANLMQALPNAAKIGFTGTPIIAAAKKRTEEIFGPVIDIYTIQQSRDDGATVPIVYEGRTAPGIVREEATLDQLFEDMFQEFTADEREALKRKYATEGDVLEAPGMIGPKARDMLRHYVAHVLPNGLKAQVVAVTRLAAVRYQAAFIQAQRELLAQLDALDPALATADEEALARMEPATAFLARAYRLRDEIARLEFAAVISEDRNRDPAEWREWTDKARQEARIERFKKPLADDSLAFLIVKSMLLTGFDAPPEGVLYLDRKMQGHELLQAIARVNRIYPGKERGLIVDYYGVARHLDEALAAYSGADVAGALAPLVDELPILRDRHRRAVAFFTDQGLRITDVPACVDALRDERRRVEFGLLLRDFLRSLDAVLPRREALPYVADAKRLGFIAKAAANLYRDEALHLVGAGEKVRALIDEHIAAEGVDPKIPPVDILAADFREQVQAHPSPRTRASEMEFAARYYISQHFHEDPTYYRKLSQRLEELLATLEHRWDELVAALEAITEEIRRGQPAGSAGLEPKTQAPFLRTLVAAADHELSEEELSRYARLTVEMVAHIQEEVRRAGFWRSGVARSRLMGWLVDFLDRHELAPFERLDALADELVQQARALHTRLVSDDDHRG